MAEEYDDCPECDGRLPAGARYCVHCESDLSGDGEPAVSLDDLDGLPEFDAPPSLLLEEGGQRRAAWPVRVLAALAVSIPLAPLAFFVVTAFVPVGTWSGIALFLACWLGPATYLSQARLPAEAFGKSLYLIAAGTLLVPVALAVRPVGAVDDTVLSSFGTLAAVCVVVAVAAAALGYVVTGQARRRVDGDLRYFERHREE